MTMLELPSIIFVPPTVSAQRKNPAIIESTASKQPMYWLPAVENPVKVTDEEGFGFEK
jgi:hypothetical protein